MTWFRLEGRGAFHHKVIAAGDEAYGAWVRAGQWSCDQLTDGHIPLATALLINRKPKVWAKLVEVRLLDEAEGGYRIHDFLDWNPSSDEERARREEVREKRREAGRIGGKRSGERRREEADRKHGAGSDANQDGSKREANAKHVASPELEAKAKQNEAPSPSPSPRDLTHSRAGARTREDQGEGQGPKSSSGIPTATADTLLADVERHDLLATLHGDRRWAQSVAGVFVSAGVRAPDVSAAVDAWVVDNAGKAPPEGPELDEFVRDGIGRYLKNAKARGDRERQRSAQDRERESSPGSSPAAAPEAQVVLDVFAEEWSRTHRGREYIFGARDAARAADLVTPTREFARTLGIQGREVIRHQARAFLRDADPKLSDAAHPFPMFVARINQYDPPPSRAPAAERTPLPALPPSDVDLPRPRKPIPGLGEPGMPQALLDQMARFGGQPGPAGGPS